MKKMKTWIVASLATILALGLAACSGGGKSGFTGFKSEDGPQGKFKEPITITTWLAEPVNLEVPEGQTVQDNMWTRLLKDKLNINIKYLWSVADNDFNQKITLSVASGQLPDYMHNLSYDIAVKLNKAGKLADIGEAYKKFIDPSLDAAGNILAKDENGKAYGIAPNWPITTNGNAMLGYVREDYLKNVNMKVPTTYDEFFAVAKAFAEKDPDKDGKKDSVGFAVGKDLLSGISSFNGIFYMHNSFPAQWVEKDGKIIYGATAPETKEALAKIREMYTQKLIHPEFYNLNQWDNSELIFKQKAGLVICATWGPTNFFNQTLKTDNAKWIPFVLKQKNGDIAKFPVGSNRPGSVAAMNASTPYPEAIIKMMNIMTDKFQHDPEYGAEKLLPSGKTFYPTFLNRLGQVLITEVGGSQTMYRAMLEAQRTGDTSKLNQDFKAKYDIVKNYEKKPDPNYYGQYFEQMLGGTIDMADQILQKGAYVQDQNDMPETDNTSRYLSALQSKRDEIFVNIITGKVDLDKGFNDWLDYYKNNGGPAIEKDIMDWHAKNKK